VAADDPTSVERLLGVARNQLSVDGLEDGDDVALLVDVLVEVGAIVGVSAVDKPRATDGSCVALQAFQQEKPLLVIMLLEYKAGREEMESGQVLLVVCDTADLEGPETTGKLLILDRKSFNSFS
jgi:hypothetical protein